MIVPVQYAQSGLTEQMHVKVVVVVPLYRVTLENDDGDDEWEELLVVLDEA